MLRDVLPAIAEAMGGTGADGGEMSNARLITILVVNGATLLIVVLLMIKTNAKTQDRLFDGFSGSVRALTDEIHGLRADIRASASSNAVAIGQLTDRVSRIEGIALRSEFGNNEITGVQRMPTPPPGLPDGFHEEPTPVLTPMPRAPLSGRTGQTPPVGVPKLSPTAGLHGPSRPKTRG